MEFGPAHLLILAGLLLAGCAAADEPPERLSALDIRASLSHRLIDATAPDGTHYFIRFSRPSTAEIIGTTSEFARWTVDPEHGLCLALHQEPPRCAPVYRLNVAHFRWGDTLLSDISIRRPGFDFDHDRFHQPSPFPRFYASCRSAR